jgi:hypothetical protein
MAGPQMLTTNQAVFVHFRHCTVQGVVQSGYNAQGSEFLDIVLRGDDDCMTFAQDEGSWFVHMDSEEREPVRITN